MAAKTEPSSVHFTREERQSLLRGSEELRAQCRAMRDLSSCDAVLRNIERRIALLDACQESLDRKAVSAALVSDCRETLRRLVLSRESLALSRETMALSRLMSAAQRADRSASPTPGR